MSLEINKSEKAAIFAELKTDYLYIALPFFILILMKLYIGSWQDIFLTADWSLAACLVFGQSASKFSRSIVSTKKTIINQQFGWYTAKRNLFVMLSLLVYFGMTAKPCLELGVFQILVFCLASYIHFKDGYAALLIAKFK